MKDNKIGWAIVGLGKYATQQIIPAFQDCQHSRLVALVSGSREKARKIAQAHGLEEKNLYDYDSYDTLRENPEVDVVYIVLPNGMHAEYTIRGAQAGKHILCEKPMATSVADAEAMIAACRQADRKLMIGYRAQYEAYNRKAIEMVQGGELGELKLITSDHGRPLNLDDKHDQWRVKKDLAGGGSLMDIGIYSLNAARYLTGEEPVEISAMMYNTPNDPKFAEVEDNITFSLRFPSGVLANCSSSYSFDEVKKYEIMGTNARLILDPATDYDKHNLWVSDADGTRQIEVEGNNHFAAQLDHFSECILQNKTPKTPGEEGLRDVKLMMAIYEAARTGQTIKL